MVVKKRDQRQYDLVQQHHLGLLLNTILGLVKDLGDPYEVKPGLGGMKAYRPNAMAVVCIMLEVERTIATLEKICNGFWIPENIRFTVNVDARVLQKV